MKLRALIAMIAFTVVGQAQAGLLIDPYVGIGQAKNTIDAATGSEGTESMTSIGSRLGYSFLLFSAGIDYERSTIDKDTATNMSAFVGFDLPILLRVWAEYFVSSSYDADDSTDPDLNFKDGYGMGIGFTGLPFVSINLEVAAYNYDFDFGNQKVDYALGTTLLSVSLPLDF